MSLNSQNESSLDDNILHDGDESVPEGDESDESESDESPRDISTKDLLDRIKHTEELLIETRKKAARAEKRQVAKLRKEMKQAQADHLKQQASTQKQIQELTLLVTQLVKQQSMVQPTTSRRPTSRAHVAVSEQYLFEGDSDDDSDFSSPSSPHLESSDEDDFDSDISEKERKFIVKSAKKAKESLRSRPRKSWRKSIKDLNSMRSVRLGENNWLEWSRETENILRFHDLWKIVANAPPKRLTKTYHEKNLCAKMILTSSIKEHVLYQVSATESAHVIWETLKPQPDIAHIASIKKNLNSLHIDNFSSGSMFLGAAKKLFDEYNLLSATKIPEADFVRTLYEGLTHSKGGHYNQMVERFDEQVRDGRSDVLTFVHFRKNLIAKEKFVRTQEKRSKKEEENTLRAAGFVVKCYTCGEEGHKSPECTKQNNDDEKDKENENENKVDGDKRKRKTHKNKRQGPKKVINMLTIVDSDPVQVPNDVEAEFTECPTLVLSEDSSDDADSENEYEPDEEQQLNDTSDTLEKFWETYTLNYGRTKRLSSSPSSATPSATNVLRAPEASEDEDKSGEVNCGVANYPPSLCNRVEMDIFVERPLLSPDAQEL